jgi:hypothetical protein
MNKSFLNTLVFGVSVAAAGVAFGSQTSTVSPLDPLAYVGQPTAQASQGSRGGYVDAANPLDPAHTYTRAEREFRGTAAVDAKPYSDSKNPLDPNYVRR